MEYAKKLPAIAVSLLIGTLGAVGVSQFAAGSGVAQTSDVTAVGGEEYEVVPLDGTRAPGIYFEPDGSVIATEKVLCPQPDGIIKLVPVETVLGPFEISGTPDDRPSGEETAQFDEAEAVCAPPGLDVELRVVDE